MLSYTQKPCFKLISLFIALTMSFNMAWPYQARAQGMPFALPEPNKILSTSSAFDSVMIKGIKFYADDPFKFDFIVDSGNAVLDDAALKSESQRLIRYFLAGLTIPQKDLWVNLSPYEKDRMIPEALGQTDMGRDLLGQDYILKQLTSSMLYPENSLGKEFWDKVHQQAQAMFGTTNVPISTFNKIWIMPESADIYASGDKVFLTGMKFKVMLEEDYLAMSGGKSQLKPNLSTKESQAGALSSRIMKEIILPAIQDEVNNGKNFAPLRQICYSLILAAWYKTHLTTSIINSLYSDKSKTQGINLDDPTVKEQIYQRYSQAFKKGAYNYIKKEFVPGGMFGKTTVFRKYFSGGFTAEGIPGEVPSVIEMVQKTNPITGNTGKINDAMKGPVTVAQTEADDTTGKISSLKNKIKAAILGLGATALTIFAGQSEPLSYAQAANKILSSQSSVQKQLLQDLEKEHKQVPDALFVIETENGKASVKIATSQKKIEGGSSGGSGIHVMTLPGYTIEDLQKELKDSLKIDPAKIQEITKALRDLGIGPYDVFSLKMALEQGVILNYRIQDNSIKRHTAKERKLSTQTGSWSGKVEALKDTLKKLENSNSFWGAISKKVQEKLSTIGLTKVNIQIKMDSTAAGWDSDDAIIIISDQSLVKDSDTLGFDFKTSKGNIELLGTAALDGADIQSLELKVKIINAIFKAFSDSKQPDSESETPKEIKVKYTPSGDITVEISNISMNETPPDYQNYTPSRKSKTDFGERSAPIRGLLGDPEKARFKDDWDRANSGIPVEGRMGKPIEAPAASRMRETQALKDGDLSAAQREADSRKPAAPGGIDANTDKVKINQTGQADLITFPSIDLGADSADFDGMTLPIVKIENLRSTADLF